MGEVPSLIAPLDWRVQTKLRIQIHGSMMIFAHLETFGSIKEQGPAEISRRKREQDSRAFLEETLSCTNRPLSVEN